MNRLYLTTVAQIALVVLCPIIELGHCCGFCCVQVECRDLECDHDHEDVHEEPCNHDDGDGADAPHECPVQSKQCNSCICDGAVLISPSSTNFQNETISLERLTLDVGPDRLFVASGLIDGLSVAFHRLSGWEIRALIESLTL